MRKCDISKTTDVITISGPIPYKCEEFKDVPDENSDDHDDISQIICLHMYIQILFHRLIVFSALFRLHNQLRHEAMFIQGRFEIGEI